MSANSNPFPFDPEVCDENNISPNFQELDPLGPVLEDPTSPLEGLGFLEPFLSTPSSGQPQQTGPDFYGSLVGSQSTDPVQVMYLGADWDGDFDPENMNTSFSGYADFGVAKIAGEHDFSENGHLEGELAALKGRVEGDGGVTRYGGGITILGKASVVTGTIQGTIGDKNTNARLQLQGDLATVDANLKFLFGSNGKQYGIAQGFGLSASSLSGEAGGGFSLFGIVDVECTVGGSVGSAGLAAGGNAFYNTEDDRVHVGGNLGAEFGLGVDLGCNISFGGW